MPPRVKSARVKSIRSKRGCPVCDGHRWLAWVQLRDDTAHLCESADLDIDYDGHVDADADEDQSKLVPASDECLRCGCFVVSEASAWSASTLIFNTD